MALVTDRFRRKFADRMVNAFPLIKKDPKELLQEQLRDIAQGKASELEQAKSAARFQAYKRFIEDTEKQAMETSKFAVERQIKNNEFDAAEQAKRHKMLATISEVGHEQHKQILAK